MRSPLVLAASFVAIALTQAGCLHLRLVDASVHKPSNVVVYFSITDAKNHPVASMTADDFKIFEDGKIVSAFESKQTILNPELAVTQYTLLLMDMSGSVTASGRVGELVEAASTFAERVGKTQEVAVYAFDGQKDIHPIASFSPGGANLHASIATLATYKAKDPSTNLNGAVVEGLHLLDAQMARSNQPLRVGSLVVFTDGTDHAHRVSRAELVTALDQSPVNIYVIGVGAEIDEGELALIGRSRSITSKDPTAIRRAFAELGQIVEDYGKSFYLLSYCSPARAGEHDMAIEADPPGKGHGKMEYHFNAAGFGPDCNPNAPPTFDVHKPRVTRRR